MASAGNGARQIRDGALRARSIRVLVSPTPVTFAERRSVLQVLEQHGPVEVFKMSPGFYSNFISVTKENMTAQKLIASSPLTYSVTEPSRTTADDIYLADLAEPDSLSSAAPSVEGLETSKGVSAEGDDALPREQLRSNPEPKKLQKQFKLEIFPAPEYHHRFAMSGSPLYNSWPAAAHEKDRSLMATTLRQSVPQTMAGKGLSHWLLNLGGAPKMERKAKRLQVKGWLPSNMKK